jgi:hypothetical protein
MLVWDPEGADDRVWTSLREHLTDPEIVELGSFIAVTYGQQRVTRPGVSATASCRAIRARGSLAPGRSASGAARLDG